ncbi:MAG: SPW repeat protein [Chloroflexi bacterium]|nr:SPW repeat protein [Chloroflexota bacterium]
MRTASDMGHASPAVDLADFGRLKWSSGINIIAGLWLIISPWVLGFSGLAAVRNNDVILGIIIVVLAAIREFGAHRASWLSWINVIAGAWVFVSAFVLSASTQPAPFWNNIILGVIVFVLGISSATVTAHHTVTA